MVKKGRGSKKGAKGPKWVAVSGGFDPLHIGHVRMLKQARKLGDKLVVILNNDNWLKNKKGFVFMAENERKEVIEMFPFVDKVVLTEHKISDPDRSVVRSLEKLMPDVFANGGDRKPDGDPVPEEDFANQKGIKLVYNIGYGGKVQSSSWMLSRARRDSVRGVRPWGEYYEWDSGEKWYVKTLYVGAGKRLSLQYHHKRAERWVLVEGDAYAMIGEGKSQKKHQLKIGVPFVVDQGTVHRLGSKKGGIVAEVAIGSSFDEADIIRLEDDHGRVSA